MQNDHDLQENRCTFIWTLQVSISLQFKKYLPLKTFFFAVHLWWLNYYYPLIILHPVSFNKYLIISLWHHSTSHIFITLRSLLPSYVGTFKKKRGVIKRENLVLNERNSKVWAFSFIICPYGLKNNTRNATPPPLPNQNVFNLEIRQNVAEKCKTKFHATYACSPIYQILCAVCV